MTPRPGSRWGVRQCVGWYLVFLGSFLGAILVVRGGFGWVVEFSAVVAWMVVWMLGLG